MRRKIDIQENDDGSFSYTEVRYRMEKVQDPNRGVFFMPLPESTLDGARENASGLMEELGRILGVKTK